MASIEHFYHGKALTITKLKLVNEKEKTMNPLKIKIPSHLTTKNENWFFIQQL